nr:EOG090X0HOM [Sida crystallina]
MASKPEIYHEKQIKQFCALHTLNNLFQTPNAFTKCSLDQLCEQLSPQLWFNPHRSMLGLGNYDVNVMIAALQSKNYEMIWWDKRRPVFEISMVAVFGLILNISSPSRIGGVTLPFKSKHWIAIRSFNGTYYNLDSKLDNPLPIGNQSQLMEYLKRNLCQEDCELFIITSLSDAVPCVLAEEEDSS